MKKTSGIEIENQAIENSIKEIATKLFRNKEVDAILGYSAGTIPMASPPIIIRKESDVNKLVWNNFCSINLAKNLLELVPKSFDDKKNNLKIGIVAKGCVGRALIHLAAENQIELKNIKIIGIACNGIINKKRIEKEIGEREIIDISLFNEDILIKGKGFEQPFSYNEYLNELCKKCKVKSPPTSPELKEICSGKCEEVLSIEDDFKDISDYELKSYDEKWKYVKDLLTNCIRCYACREACPMCYCHLCFVDQNKPLWFGKTTELSEIIIFHLIRAMHLAGRCVACGACTSVCPMGIDLNLITRKLEQIVKERFNFTSGLNIVDLPPMATLNMSDKEDFITEEN